MAELKPQTRPGFLNGFWFWKFSRCSHVCETYKILQAARQTVWDVRTIDRGQLDQSPTDVPDGSSPPLRLRVDKGTVCSFPLPPSQTLGPSQISVLQLVADWTLKLWI